MLIVDSEAAPCAARESVNCQLQPGRILLLNMGRLTAVAERVERDL
jgi:hypothetical protein